MVTATGRRTARTGFFSRLLRISLVVLAFPVLAIVLSVLNNNFSFPRLSRADFVKSLDRSWAASTNWATDQFISIGNSGDVEATPEGVERFQPRAGLYGDGLRRDVKRSSPAATCEIYEAT